MDYAQAGGYIVMAEAVEEKKEQKEQSKQDQVTTAQNITVDGVSYQSNYNTDVAPAILAAAREEIKSGRLDITKRAQELGISVDAFKDIAAEGMTNLEKEQNPYFKSNLSGVDIDTSGEIVSDHSIKDRIIYRAPGGSVRLDMPAEGETKEVAGCKITQAEHGNNLVCHSEYLGDFDYDPDVYAIGYIEIPEENGTTSQLPVLRYVGDVSGFEGSARNLFGNNTIPEGVKHLDYTFADTEIKGIPEIPDSVESMHYSFAGCEKLVYGNSGVISDQGITLPENLKDASGAFKGCKNLYPLLDNDVTKSAWPNFIPFVGVYNTFGAVGSTIYKSAGHGSLVGVKEKGDFDTNNRWPSGLVNISEMFEGCDKIDGYCAKVFGMGFQQNGFKLPGLGGEYTPYLSSVTAKDAFAHVDASDTRLKDGTEKYAQKNGKTFEETTDSIQYAIKEDGSLNEGYDSVKNNMTEERKAAMDVAQATTAGLSIGANVVDPVKTNKELESGNKTSNAWIKDENGNWRNDTTALKETTPSAVEGMGLEKAGILGLTGLGLFATSGLITRNKYIGLLTGVVGTAILNKTGILGDSFAPLLKFTSGLLPEGKLKSTLQGWMEKLPSVQLEEQKKRVSAFNATWDDDHKVAAEWQDERMGAEGQFADINKVTHWNLSKYMQDNGKACAQTFTLQATYAAGDNGMKPVTGVVSTAVKAMEAEWNDKIKAAGGVVSPELKVEMQNYYGDVISALGAYGDGAKEGIESKFKKGSADYESSYAGLAMANKAYMDVVLQSMQTMNEQYQFMNDKAWQSVRATKLYGIDCSTPTSGASYSTEGTDVMKKAEAAIQSEKVKADLDAKTTETKSSLSNSFSEATSEAGTTTDKAQTDAQKSAERANEAAMELHAPTDDSQTVETEDIAEVSDGEAQH